MEHITPPAQSRRCTTCGETKPFADFNKSPTGKHGLASQCKLCRSAWHRKYYQANKDKIIAKSLDYARAHKEEIAAWHRVYYVANKEKIKEKSRRWYIEHKERSAASRRAYSQTPHGRAVRQASRARRRMLPDMSYITATTMQEVQEASNGICPYCGEPFENGHIDHIIPVSKGGTNDRKNLTYCCAHCNLVKHNKLLEDWLYERQDTHIAAEIACG